MNKQSENAASHIEYLIATIAEQQKRIEMLEVTLREIMDCEELDAFTLQDIARAALDKK